MSLTESGRTELGRTVLAARKDAGLSKQKAAKAAHISVTTWKRVEDGLEVQDVKLHAALKSLGIEPVDPWVAVETQTAARHLREQLNPALARFTDYELLTEISDRIQLMAALLAGANSDALEFVTDEEGQNVVTSRPRSE